MANKLLTPNKEVLYELQSIAAVPPIKHPLYPQENFGSGFLEQLRLSTDSTCGSLQSWFEYDSELGESNADGHTNWGAISGLALSVAFSASFWAGVAWIVARVWR